MSVSYYNYRKLHSFLQPEVSRELEHLFSLDSDDDFHSYLQKGEKQLSKAFPGMHCVGLSSGTTALQFALTGLGIKRGDEVITVPNTYIATLHAIANTGAKPVLVDADNETLLMDTHCIDEKISPQTRAILPVHLFGQMADMEAIAKIARNSSLKTVEDAAQAHGAKYRGESPGSKSNAACYSLFMNKSFGGIGNGGMLTTTYRDICKKARILRDADANDPLLLQSHRTPANLDWFHLAFLKAKMPYLKKWCERRREIAKIYQEGISSLPLRLTGTDKRAYHVYRDFAVRTPFRTALRLFLKAKGVQTVVHYSIPAHLTKVYRHLGYSKGSFPVAEDASRTILSLPINPFLSDEEVFYTISSIRQFFRLFGKRFPSKK